MEFLCLLYDQRGPITREEVKLVGDQRHAELAHRAVALFQADLRRTTSLDPDIAIWRHDEIDTLVVFYDGNFSTPAISSLRAPEALCEVADNLRDHVVDDLWSVWPVCPADGLGLDPRVVEGQAVWYCRVRQHLVSPIGALPPSRIQSTR